MREAGDSAIHDTLEADRQHDPQLSAATFREQMELAERLLNDPFVPLEPGKVWAVVEKLSQYTGADEG